MSIFAVRLRPKAPAMKRWLVGMRFDADGVHYADAVFEVEADDGRRLRAPECGFAYQLRTRFNAIQFVLFDAPAGIDQQGAGELFDKLPREKALALPRVAARATRAPGPPPKAKRKRAA